MPSGLTINRSRLRELIMQTIPRSIKIVLYVLGFGTALAIVVGVVQSCT